MDTFTFDVDGILTPEEAKEMFDKTTNDPVEPEEVQEQEKETPVEKEDKIDETPSEKVGEDTKVEDNAITTDDDGSSPDNIYSSIANALKNDGIFPDFTDEDLTDVKTADDFADLVEKAVDARFDERQKRIEEMLSNGVPSDTIKQYEQTLQYLGSIDEDALKQEGETGDDLRKQLIYNDFLQRGFSAEKATREVEKSFKSGSDIDDAKDALASLKEAYQAGYKSVQDNAKAQAEARKEQQQKQAEAFKKSVLEDDVKVGDTILDKRTCQRIFDAVNKPVYKDKTTGQLRTAVQKFQDEHPIEFLKQIGMWFVLTDGGKNFEGIAKEQVRAAKNKNIEELSRKINSSALNRDGSLAYAGGKSKPIDPLLSDDWKIG